MVYVANERHSNFRESLGLNILSSFQPSVFHQRFSRVHFYLSFVLQHRIFNMSAVQARSLYRRFLRELPARSPSILANPSPVQKHIRDDFSTPSDEAATASSPSLQHQQQKSAEKRLEEGEQFLHYLQAQRTYTTLLERYNPGMNMNEEEKVRLTARRVGMELPAELMPGRSGGSGKRG